MDHAVVALILTAIAALILTVGCAIIWLLETTLYAIRITTAIWRHYMTDQPQPLPQRDPGTTYPGSSTYRQPAATTKAPAPASPKDQK